MNPPKKILESLTNLMDTNSEIRIKVGAVHTAVASMKFGMERLILTTMQEAATESGITEIDFEQMRYLADGQEVDSKALDMLVEIWIEFISPEGITKKWSKGEGWK